MKRRARTFIAAMLALAVFLFPLVWIVFLSLKNHADIIGLQSSLLKSPITFENYLNVLGREDVLDRLTLSFFLAVGVGLITSGLSFPAAHAISRLANKRRAEVAAFFISFKIVPSVAVSVPIYLTVQQLSVVSPVFAYVLLLVALTVPIAVWLAVPVFQSVQVEHEEQARLYGLSDLKLFLAVVAPIVADRLVMVAILIALLAWNETYFASIFGVHTIAELLPSLITHRGTQWGLVMAVASLVILPSLLGAIVFAARSWSGRND